MTCEFGPRGRRRAASAAAPASCRERAVAMVATARAALPRTRCSTRLLDVDPELLLPYVTVSGSAACSGWRSPAWRAELEPAPATARCATGAAEVLAARRSS